MDKLQAIGREIRYVEYKLRRQQQEKKKKKQNRDAWMNSGNGSGLETGSGSAKFGQEVRASEITFNDDSSKFETDRPANKDEEDLQLELALAMSRDEQTKETTPSANSATISAPPIVQPPAPVQSASLLDISFDNQQQQKQHQAAVVQSSPWGSQQAAPQQQAQPSWDPFSNTGVQQAVQQSNPVATQSPWETPTTSSPPIQSVGGGGAWQAFDDSFQSPTNPQPDAQTPQQSANITTPAPPAQNIGAVPDLFGAPLAPSSTQQAVLNTANQPVDDLFGASDPNQNTQMQNEILKPKKTASDFLGGKGASLVNLDNLVSRPSIPGGNPFGSGGSGMKQNPFQKASPGFEIFTNSPGGVPINQMSKPMNGFDSSGGGMVPLQPTSSNIMSPTGSIQAGNGSQYNSVFSSQPSNLLFGAQPMSSGHYQNKNPFS
jgi:hypothetical protein